MDHDPCEQVGVVENCQIEGDRVGRAVVRFGRSDDAEEVFGTSSMASASTCPSATTSTRSRCQPDSAQPTYPRLSGNRMRSASSRSCGHQRRRRPLRIHESAARARRAAGTHISVTRNAHDRTSHRPVPPSSARRSPCHATRQRDLATSGAYENTAAWKWPRRPSPPATTCAGSTSRS